MNFLKSLLTISLICSVAQAAMTTTTAKLSPSLNEYDFSVLTDENSNKIPLIGIVFPDSDGATGIASSKFQVAGTSSVTGKRGAPLYKTADGKRIPVFALAKIDTTSNLPVPLTFPASGITLAGDVTGAASSNTVATVGGSTASAVNAATVLANAATSANTASAIVKRDSSGNFTAGTITGSLTGAASLNVLKAGDTMSGALAMGTNKITGLGDPTSAQDAATKAYVDKIEVLTSNASTGGSATESLTVTGLLTTDTILSVSQSAAGANSTAVIAYGSPGSGTLSVSWTADPGAGAVVKVLVKHQ